MNKKIQIASSFFRVLSTIHQVERQLKGPVNKRLFGALFHQLEHAQKECKDQHLQQTIISLYRKVVNRYVDTQIEEIAYMANCQHTNAKTLKRKISSVKSYGLSPENYTTLMKVEQKLSNKKSSLLFLPPDLQSVEDLLFLAEQIYFQRKPPTVPWNEVLSTRAFSCIQKYLPHTHDSFTTVIALWKAAHDLAGRPLLSEPKHRTIHSFFRRLPS